MAKKLSVSDVMTRDVTTLYEESSLQQVLVVLAPYRFRHLPVVDGTQLVGIISQRDLLQVLGQGHHPSNVDKLREVRALEETFVRDVMNTKVITIRLEASLAQAAASMLENHVGALPVVNERNELLGIITSTDLLRSMAHAL